MHVCTGNKISKLGRNVKPVFIIWQYSYKSEAAKDIRNESNIILIKNL